MVTKNLTVRFDPELRDQLERIADREVRPMASQIVVFVRQGIEKYLQDNNLHFDSAGREMKIIASSPRTA